MAEKGSFTFRHLPVGKSWPRASSEDAVTFICLATPPLQNHLTSYLVILKGGPAK